MRKSEKKKHVICRLHLVTVLTVCFLLGMSSLCLASELPVPVDGAKTIDVAKKTRYTGKLTKEKPYCVFKVSPRKNNPYCKMSLSVRAFAKKDIGLRIAMYTENGILVNAVETLGKNYNYDGDGERVYAQSSKIPDPIIDYDFNHPFYFDMHNYGRIYYLVVTPGTRAENAAEEVEPRYSSFVMTVDDRGANDSVDNTDTLKLSKTETVYTGRPITLQGTLTYGGTYDPATKNLTGRRTVSISQCKTVRIQPLYYKSLKYREVKEIKDVGRYRIDVYDQRSVKEIGGSGEDIFTVKPAVGRITSAQSTGKRKLVVKTALDRQYTGAELEVSTDPAFQKNVKRYRMKSQKALTKLSSGKTYYIRLRYYKTCYNNLYSRYNQYLDVVDTKEDICGAWSGTQQVVCK